jgi:heme exporter protein A
MILADAGLRGFESQSVSTLSAGQKQRLSLSRLLVHNKHLWILDEPQSHLDLSGRAWLQTLISKHLLNNGLAVIVSHAGELPIPKLRMLELSK